MLLSALYGSVDAEFPSAFGTQDSVQRLKAASTISLSGVVPAGSRRKR
jgi:hypothetical protein